MLEGLGAYKLPNDFIESLVKRHMNDIFRLIPCFSDRVVDERVDDFFNIDIKDTKSQPCLPIKEKQPLLPTKGSQRELLSIGKSMRNISNQNPLPDINLKDGSKTGFKKSKSATEDTHDSRSGSRVLDKSIVRSRRACGFAPGPSKPSLIPRSYRSIKDIPKESLPKDPVCRSMKEIPNKNSFNWNDEVNEVTRKPLNASPTPPLPLPPVKVVGYRTQVELGLNYLIKLDIDSQTFLAVIWQKQSLQATEVSRVTKL